MSKDIKLTGDFSAPAAPKNDITQDINLHLGKRLRRRRKLLGLTQTDLAQAVGVRFQQIQKYECGANKMNAERLWQFSQALEVPITYFFDGLTCKLQPLVASEPQDTPSCKPSLNWQPL